MRLRCRVASLLRKNCFYFPFVLRNRDDLHSRIIRSVRNDAAHLVDVTVRAGSDFIHNGPVGPDFFHLTDYVHKCNLQCVRAALYLIMKLLFIKKMASRIIPGNRIPRLWETIFILSECIPAYNEGLSVFVKA